MDQVLNITFFVFHTAWIVFNSVGWISRRTRHWHLATITLTALSWFGLGPWYGWGYCPCTDWHWRVRARLGYHDPESYMQLLIAEVTGIGLTASTANALTGSVFALLAGLTIILNVRDFRSGRRHQTQPVS